MQHKLLGRTGLRVSKFCLGTMAFGATREWGADEQTSRQVFDRFVAAGGNFLDTAPGYQVGESETLVGKFIASERDRYVVATKFSLTARPGDLNSCGNGRKSMMAAVDNSLRRMKTEYVDLYWMHAWDGVTPEEEVLRGLDDLVRAGKVHHIGFSDTPAWVVARSQAIAELRGWTSLAAIQIPYSLADRTPDRELLPMADALGLSVVTWGGLGSGLLSGKYKVQDGAVSGDGRLAKPDYPAQDRRANVFEIVDALMAGADQLNVRPSQLALAWLRQRSSNIIPIIGARTLEQLEENLAAEDIGTEAEEIFERLDEASAVTPGFPTEFLNREPIQKLLFAGMRHKLDAGSKLSA